MNSPMDFLAQLISMTRSNEPPLLWYENKLMKMVDKTITKLGNEEFNCQEDRVKKIFRLMANEGFPIFHTQVLSKTEKKSTEFRNEGNEYFKNNELDKACEAYTKSVAHAPQDSQELSLAFANRSAVLFKAKLMNDCLYDINRALENDYPNKLKSKLYYRKAACHQALDPNDRSSIEMALSQARQFLDKMDEKNQLIMKKKLDDLEASEVTEPATCYNWKNIELGPMPKLAGENSTLPGLSDALELTYSEKYGRHIVATRDIKPGELLAIQKPYAKIVNENIKYRYCWHCGRQTCSAIPCEICSEVVFCSVACRDDAQSKYHDIECSIAEELRDYGIPDLHLMALEMTIMAYKEAGCSIDTLRKNVEAINAVKDRANKGFTDGVLLPDKFTSTQGLIAQHIRGINNLGVRRECLAIVVAILSAFFFAKKIKLIDVHCTKIDESISNDDLEFLVGFIENNNCLTFSTLMGIGSAPDDYDYGAVMVLVPALSFFNHSCIPMITRTSYGEHVLLRAVSPIQKGEQVYQLSSQPFFQQEKKNREHEIKDHYFVCECEACVNDWPVVDNNQPQIVDDVRNMKIMTPKTFKYGRKVKELQNFYVDYAKKNKKLIDVSECMIEGAKLLEKSHNLLRKNSVFAVELLQLFVETTHCAEMPFFSLD